MKLETGRGIMPGERVMFPHSEQNRRRIVYCIVKESWLFRDMQNLLSLCFSNNYI